MNVIFESQIGEIKSGSLTSNFTRSEFMSLAQRLFGSINGMKFLIKGKQIKLENDNDFNRYKNYFSNDCVIKTAKAMISGYPPLNQLISEISLEAAAAFSTVNKTSSNVQCSTCMESKLCIQFSCSECSKSNILCATCAYRNFKTNDLTFMCISCNKKVDYNRIFTNSQSFKRKYSTLQDMYDMCRNIDCQICRCGEFHVNETLFSKQSCSRCARWFCFFCNKTWDDTLMTNNKYTCHNNCTYENATTYEEVPINHSTKIRETLPNRRTCPECKTLGCYGGASKMHTCLNCRHQFCFICLRPQSKCSYNSDKECKLLSQTYGIFPKSTD
ncbi:unnamed protein product [Rotaria socialis]|uniref:RING-type domain-containing protein n=1 Tax=Rotaria socialis TaxID=392032 RepID=A0A821EKT9_9BILA|nr:unnamed protein product [Rotaria socialis]CAF3465343.1 unnamed protein product [Rotaria socialis]CAF4638947.1 unnamed protein product [Rotaria socialis]CAF4821980.1 unnamed protein product [Rotaria socialis]